MSHLSRTILVLVGLVFFINLSAILPTSVEVRTVSSQQTDISFRMPSFEIVERKENDTIFHEMVYKDGIPAAEIGLPEIPHYVATIAVPVGAKVSIGNINMTNPRTINGLTIFPVQNYENLDYIFDIDSKFYESPDPQLSYPAERYFMTDIQSMRDFQFVVVRINPVKFFPADNTLEIVDEIRMTILHPHGGGEPVYTLRPRISAAFEPMYEQLISNYDQIRAPNPLYQEPSILIIHANSYGTTGQNALNQIINWKRQKGFYVRAETISTAGGANSTNVRNYIQAQLASTVSNPPEWVMLIGTNSIIPHIQLGTTTGGDYGYTYPATGASIGLVNIGRIPVSTDSQLDDYWRKMSRYEKFPISATPSENEWFKRNLLSGDSASSGVSTYIVNRYIKSIISAFDPTHTFLENYSRTSSVVNNAQTDYINLGGALNFNFRGFQGMAGYAPSGMTNTNRMPFGVWLSCSTHSNAITATLRMSNNLPAGCITAVGMTDSATKTPQNNALSGSIFYGNYAANMPTAGQSVLFAQNYLQIIYPNCSLTLQQSVKTVLYGDPSLYLWRTAPRTFLTPLPTSIPLGTQSLRFHVVDSAGANVPGAVVTITNNAGINPISYISKAIADQEGIAYLPIDPNQAGPFVITITKQDFAPRVPAVTAPIPISSTNPMVSVISHLVTDPAPTGNNNGQINPGERVHLTIQVKNHLSSSVSGLSATLSSDSGLITIQNQTVMLSPGNIGAGMTQAFDEVFTFDVSPFTPDKSLLPLTITITDGSNTWVSHLLPEIRGVDIEIVSMTNSSGGSHLNIGTNTNIHFNLKNSGLYQSYALQAELITRSPFLTVTSSTYAEIPNMNPNGTANHSATPFTVSVTDIIIPGMRLPAELHIWNDNGYEAVIPVFLTAGVKTVNDPTGPCDYGYIIYDCGDTGYEDAPVYNWIDIKHLPGANTGMIDNVLQIGTFPDVISVEEANVVKQLPFTARFYGVDYDVITICSNGFFTFGLSEQKDFRNLPIPGPIVPRAMVAPYWTDLAFPMPPTGTTSVGAVYAAYYPPEQAYIIQFDRVHYVINSQNHLTHPTVSDSVSFQVLIYDPEHHGVGLNRDSPMKIQYRRFFQGIQGASDRPYQFITVGFQDHTATRGLQYCFNNVYTPGSRTLTHNRALLITQPSFIAQQPHLMVSRSYIHTPTGSNTIQAGDDLNLGVSIINSGQVVASEVVGTLSVPPAFAGFVEILNETSIFSDVAPAETQSNLDYFSVKISPDTPHNQQITLSLELTTRGGFGNDGGHTWNRQITFTVSRPSITYRSYMINDSEGNGDGIADPGENLKLIVNLANATNFDIHGVSATLTTTSSHATINDDIADIPIMTATTVNQFTFDITLAAELDGVSHIPFNLEVTSANAPTFNRTILLGVNQAPAVFNSTFENLSGWNTSGGTTGIWSISNTNEAGGEAPELLFAGVSGSGLARLISPQIDLTDVNQIIISFKHKLNVVSNWGGTLVGVQTRPNASSQWLNVWTEELLTESFPAGTMNIPVSNSHVGSSTFQFSFMVNGLYSVAPQWYIDDVVVQVAYGNSAKVSGLVSVKNFAERPFTELKVKAGDFSVAVNEDRKYEMYLLPGLYPSISVFDPFIVVRESHNDIELLPGEIRTDLNFVLDYKSPPWDLIVYEEDETVPYRVKLSFQHRYDRVVNPLGLAQYSVYRQINSTQYVRVQTIPRDTAWADTLIQFTETLIPSNRYRYYVTAVYVSGESQPSNILHIDPNNILVSTPSEDTYEEPDDPIISDSDEVLLPSKLTLYQNFPNPFNPTTNISYTVPEASVVSIKIYNIKGQLVRNLIDEYTSAGTHTVQWHGDNDSGRAIGSGIYFIRISDQHSSVIRKAVLLK
jgi:hypothetical protein